MWGHIKEIEIQNQGRYKGKIVDGERNVSGERGGQIKREVYILVYADDVVARDENVMRTMIVRLEGYLHKE